MRPIRLELTNFTIFRGNHSLDFSGLRFFIIQGRTGSGKTSLIDAMCYALFGRVPRHGRENLHENIISKGEDYLRVFFEFAVKDRRYAIERFIKKGKAGARVYENGRLKDIRVNEIPQFVGKILGVDYETFTKVILLPQGQFDRFLKPEQPRQRREILNKLLGMDALLSKLNELIRDTKRKIENELTQIEASLNELSYATKEKLQRLEESIKLIEDKLVKLNSKKEELQKELELAIQRDNLEKDLLNCENELEKLLSQKHQIEKLEIELQKMEEASSYSAYLEIYERLSQQERQERAEIKTLELELRKLAHEKERILKQIEPYSIEWQRIDLYDSEIERLTKEVERLKSALEKIRERDRMMQELEQTLEHKKILEQDIESLEARILKGEEFVREKESYLETLEKKKNRLLEITPLKSKLDYIKRERQALDHFLSENKTLEEDINKLMDIIRNKEREIFNFHVHNIRVELKVGDVCPVCGNIVKDLPKEEAFEADLEKLKAQLEDLKAQERQLLEKKVRAENMARKIKQEEEELRKLLNGMQEYELEIEYEELTKSVQSIEKEKNSLKLAKEKLEKLKQELNTKKNNLSLKELQIKNLKASIEDINNYLASANLSALKEEDLRNLENELLYKRKKRDEVRRKYTQLLEELKNHELKENRLLTTLSQKKGNIERIDEEKAKLSKNLEPAIKTFGSLEDLKSYIKPKEYIRELKASIEEYKNKINSLNIKKKQLRESLKNFSHIEPTEEIKSKLQSVEDEQKRCSEELGSLKVEKTKVEEGLKRREELEESKKELESKDWVYSSLEKDFRADRLQEFVSQIMLQSIVSRANFYMQKFTSGVYEFDLENLDLLILDRVSGHRRSVSTLSGGETFLASLALAFGISEVISNNAPIESLFIDEGFGSLDKETREELSQFFELIKLNTDRVVGIISHLEDLAEKFDQRIEVIRRGDRSSIRVII
ncbi:AAA family ATPase [Thermocrinis sp.]|uniref:AAA family ATPase n=1 Tax=Thermocrinis sp. TaxID=2024383 RepID=UPI002FDCC51C